MDPLIVTNMSTGDTLVFLGPTPRQALVSAHGHWVQDANTWDHENRYGHLVQEGRFFLFLGDLAVRKPA